MKLTSISLSTPFTKTASAHNVSGRVAYAFLKDAAGDSASYAERFGEPSLRGAMSRVHITVNAELSLSFINFAHHSSKSYEERANLWEVGILVNGELYGEDEGNEDMYLYQVQTPWLKNFFKALDAVEITTAEHIVDALDVLNKLR